MTWCLYGLIIFKKRRSWRRLFIFKKRRVRDLKLKAFPLVILIILIIFKKRRSWRRLFILRRVARHHRRLLLPPAYSLLSNPFTAQKLEIGDVFWIMFITTTILKK
ncbi:hypothetical protein L1887_35016 [Cichorium endivia]|nr:hypothetical protein L1887_35016 [Cichorium endivia]